MTRLVAERTIGAPCRCDDCVAAGVTDLCIVRVPGDDWISVPHWLHGEPLKRWWAARRALLELEDGDAAR